MSELKMSGKIVNILPVESGTSKAGKEWKKQAFVIDTGDQYNPNVAFSLFGDDKIEIMTTYSVGQDVEVSFNLSSRDFNGKWYHNIDAWRIVAAGSTQSAPVQQPVASGGTEVDDLPF
jgi:hypothetical protein